MTDLDQCTEERYEERAAIREFDGKQMRSRAEIAARIEAAEWRENREIADRDREVQR